jgi:hypothetical protein
MNNIAISPYIAMYALQIQNVKRNSSKTADINSLNKKNVEEVQNTSTEIINSNNEETNEETNEEINEKVENEIQIKSI